MKRSLHIPATIGLAIILILGFIGPAGARIYPNQDQAQPILLTGEIEVQFATDVNVSNLAAKSGNLQVGIKSLDDILAKYGAYDSRPLFPFVEPGHEIVGTNNMTKFQVLSIPESVNVRDMIDELRKNPYVKTVDGVYAIPVRVTPNDQYINNQWAWNNIHAKDAWDIEKGKNHVIVADIDLGVLYTHPDLVDRIWVNPAEDLDGDRVVMDPDDIDFLDSPNDANTYADDLIGYDFFNGFGGALTCADADCSGWDNDPSDYDGHGTHTSGTMAAATNNSIGVAGLAGGWGTGIGTGAKIMCVRVGALASDGLGYVNSSACATGINYAAVSGADMINASWGAATTGVVTAFQNAADYDVVCAHAAGNDNSTSLDLVDHQYYNDYKLVLTVASNTSADQKSSFSNYGLDIDVVAPGSNILSTYSDFGSAQYVYSGGTSMSAPHVAGLAALLRSHDPNLTKIEIDSIIKANCDDMPAEPLYAAGLLGYGRINAYSAINSLGDAEFTTVSPLSGQVPLTIDFEDASPNSPTSWEWNFGDGSPVATTQDASHTYTDYGLYDVSLTIDEPRGTNTELKSHYVMATADTIRIDSLRVPPDTSVIMKVYLDNKFLAKKVQLPIKFNTTFNKVLLDSVNIEGLPRMTHQNNTGLVNYDLFGNRYYVTIEPDPLIDGSKYLQPDTGIILNLFVTITSSATNGTIVTVDTTSSFGASKLFSIRSVFADYVPDFHAGKLVVQQLQVGDVTQDGLLNLLDILMLIDDIYGSGPSVDPYLGDVNADGDINLLDILMLIDIIY